MRLSLTDKHFVLLFHTTHETMHAEAVMKDHRMRFKLIPRPRDIQDDCGLGLVIVKEDRPKVEALLPVEEIYIKAAYHIERDGQWIKGKLSNGANLLRLSTLGITFVICTFVGLGLGLLA